ncbi:hypothetical protein GBA52_020033 [Prunus armeniaca]|nr:hypothetical protein GBA52_020033 [Prunus armeniaca]
MREHTPRWGPPSRWQTIGSSWTVERGGHFSSKWGHVDPKSGSGQSDLVDHHYAEEQSRFCTVFVRVLPGCFR